jgi:ribosomal protein S18 acetylase RimI-like enzyme
MNDNVRIIEKPDLSDAELNDLFSASWTSHTLRAFRPVLQRSLTYFGAYQKSKLVGFVNVAWDGGDHAFLLDPTVLPACRRRGIGLALVAAAVKASAARGVEWLHVDYEAALHHFYRRAGFRPTQAGLMCLSPGSDEHAYDRDLASIR